MDKMKTYRMFESEIKGLLPSSTVNVEEKIDKVLENLVKKRYLVSMLLETIRHVKKQLGKSFPENVEDFYTDLQYYDDEVNMKLLSINEYLFDGYPSIEDMCEEVDKDLEELENYLKLKNQK